MTRRSVDGFSLCAFAFGDVGDRLTFRAACVAIDDPHGFMFRRIRAIAAIIKRFLGWRHTARWC